MRSLLKSILPSDKPDSSSLSYRQKVARDSISQASKLVADHATEGASPESTFISSQLPPLDVARRPNQPASLVDVINRDAFTVARHLIAETPDARGRIAVLNLASDALRAGGWEFSLSRTQEEALCYSSSLYATLKEEYYPWPNVGPGSIAGVYSPGVVVHRHDLDHNLVLLPKSERIVVSVLTVAAPRGPKLTEDGKSILDDSVLDDLREKIRLVYRMAASNGKDFIILGAMGCGAYRCPSRQVAVEMRSILQEEEFRGWFRKVIFAVYSKNDTDPETNYTVFKKEFRDVKV